MFFDKLTSYGKWWTITNDKIKQTVYNATALTFVSCLLHKCQRTEDILSVYIDNLSICNHFIQDEVRTIQIEHNLDITLHSLSYIKFAHITKHSI